MFSEINDIGIINLAKSPKHYLWFINSTAKKQQCDLISASYLEVEKPDILVNLKNTKNYQENPIFRWNEGSIKCATRPHYYTKDIICYYIVGDCAEPGAFSLQMVAEKLDVLAAFSSRGIEIATGYKPMVVFCVIEPYPPYAHGTYMVDMQTILEATGELYALFEGYRECIKNDAWPGYTTRIQRISKPGRQAAVSKPLTSWI